MFFTACHSVLYARRPDIAERVKKPRGNGKKWVMKHIGGRHSRRPPCGNCAGIPKTAHALASVTREQQADQAFVL